MSGQLVGLIWAEAHGAIGLNGSMPWHLPEDLAHFKAVTAGSTVVMGRRTWDSLPEPYRPLPGRRNLVVTRNPDWRADGAEAFPSVLRALSASEDDGVWVIGGGQIYAAALDMATVIERTLIRKLVDGDTFAPRIDASWVEDHSAYERAWLTGANGLEYRFQRLIRA